MTDILWSSMYVTPEEAYQYLDNLSVQQGFAWFTNMMTWFVLYAMPKAVRRASNVHAQLVDAVTLTVENAATFTNSPEFERLIGKRRYNRTMNYAFNVNFVLDDGRLAQSVLYINSLSGPPLFEYFCPVPNLYENSPLLRNTICDLIVNLASRWMRLPRKPCRSMCKAYKFAHNFIPNNLYITYFLQQRSQQSFKQVFDMFKNIEDPNQFLRQAVSTLQGFGKDFAHCLSPRSEDSKTVQAQAREFQQTYFSPNSTQPVTQEVVKNVEGYIVKCDLSKHRSELQSTKVASGWPEDIDMEKWKPLIPAEGAVQPTFFPPPPKVKA
uniref:Uncharacterized protein n=1 Tax=viral metagenome TaxID=1070528 RepID=A0A6C0BP42_9ZZZZ